MNDKDPPLPPQRFACLDVVMAVAVILFIGAEAYRYVTQDYLDWAGLGGLLFGLGIYWSYRKRPGEPNPYQEQDDHPYSTLTMFMLIAAVIFGVLWTFAVTDFPAESWRHATTSLLIIAPCLALCFYTTKKEHRVEDAARAADHSPPPPREHTTAQQAARRQYPWGFWFYFTAAIPYYQAKLGHGWLLGHDARAATQDPYLWVCAGFLFATTILRWVLIPMLTSFGRMFLSLIFGLILSLSLEFFALYLFPADMPRTKMVVFVLALLSALQFAPFYFGALRRKGSTG